MEPVTYTIYDVAGLNVNDVWILVHMATEPDNALTFRSAIVRRSAGLLVLERVFDEWVTSLWQSPRGIIYLVSMAGNIHTLANGVWTTTKLGQHFFLNNIWGLNDDRVYSCGMDGVFLRKTGSAWEQVDGSREGDLTRVSGTADDDLYLLGARGAILHYDGSRLRALDSPTNRKLLHLLCLSRDEVYVCGRSGALFHGSPNQWEQVDVGSMTLHSIAYFRNRVFVGAGLNGVLELYAPKPVLSPKDTVAYGLQLIGESLVAFGGMQISEYDGRDWSQQSLNFRSVVE